MNKGAGSESVRVVARWWVISLRRCGKAALCWILDCPFFCEHPFQGIKVRALNALLGAHLASDCVLMPGVRSVNWRNVSAEGGVYFADRVNIRSHGPIRVGHGTSIGPDVMLVSGGHSSVDLAPTHSPITIGRCVFIGARAMVLEGVTIGDHAMIGAGAIVARDIPPLAIAVGSPARIVAYRNPPKRAWTIGGMIPVESEIREDVPSTGACPVYSEHDAL